MATYFVLVSERWTNKVLDEVEVEISLDDLDKYSNSIWELHRCLKVYENKLKYEPGRRKKLEGKDWYIEAVEIS